MMICPYQKELKRDENGYIEHFLQCSERECMYYMMVLNPPCLRVCIDIRKYERKTE